MGQLLFWLLMSLSPVLSTLTNGRSFPGHLSDHSAPFTERLADPPHFTERLADPGHFSESLAYPGHISPPHRGPTSWSYGTEPEKSAKGWSADESWTANSTGARPSQTVMASWPNWYERNEWLHKRKNLQLK